jgi:hypothetical protein
MMSEKGENKQPALLNLPETPIDVTDFLTPVGKVKRKKKRDVGSNQSVSAEQNINKKKVPSKKGSVDEEKITEYTRWINEH